MYDGVLVLIKTVKNFKKKTITINFLNFFIENSFKKGGQVGVALLYIRLQVGHCNGWC